MKLVEITREEARNQVQYFVFNPLTGEWHIYYGMDAKSIAYDKYAYSGLKYYKVVEEI